MKNKWEENYKKNTTLSKQFIETEAKWIPLSYIYMTAYLTGLVRNFYERWRD